MLEKINGKQIKAKYLSAYLIEGKDGERGKSLNLSFYDIVYVIQSDTSSDNFKTEGLPSLNISTTLAFTTKEKCLEHTQENEKVRAITIGMLCREIKSESIEVIGVNFDGHKNFDEFIFAPPYDELTCQYILSPRDEAISLLSIDNKSHRYMGVKATFFSITPKALEVINDSERENFLHCLIDDLSFIIPRVPQPKGSANIICLLLNLENPIEERAFVRDYKTFDDYTEVLFVNSKLELLAGDLTKINYDGASLEGVYLPLIERQKNRA